MSLPYSTATAGNRALADIQKTLAEFGCQAFGNMTDNERGCMVVHFKWRDRHVQLEASWKGYAQALMKTYKHQGYGDVRARRERDALEQAKISVCSILRDWVKGQVTAIECGVLSFETAFMPHMLLPDGRRVIEAAQAAKLLPQSEESNVLQLKSIK